MPSRYVRLAFSRSEPESLIVEYGKWKIRKLTPEEEEEKKQLEEDLMEYQDFTTAQDIDDDERKEVMEKKQRLEELRALTTEGHLEWTLQDRSEVESVLFILRPEESPVYVENLPNQLIEKLLEPQFTLNLGAGSSIEEITIPIPKKDEKESVGNLKSTSGDQLKDILLTALRMMPEPSADGREWEDLVDITETCPSEGKEEGFKTEPGVLYIMPVKYLEKDWEPINVVLKSKYDENRLSWHRAGKTSHWKLKR